MKEATELLDIVAIADDHWKENSRNSLRGKLAAIRGSICRRVLQCYAFK